MDIYTLDRYFGRDKIVDDYQSIIWTERYYGDSSFEMVLPLGSKSIVDLPRGVYLSVSESDELMILETHDYDDDTGTVKMSGISLLTWMNNRFIWSPDTTVWKIVGQKPGVALWDMINHSVGEEADYSALSLPTDRIKIPNLGLWDYDTSGELITIDVPFGPLYDALRSVAVGYQVGMKIVLQTLNLEKPIAFRSYRGLDRTRDNVDNNEIVRLSKELGSLSDIKELSSIANYKNLAISSNSSGASIAWGESSLTAEAFDLRILWQDPGSTVAQVRSELVKNTVIQAIDGKIISTKEAEYGIHYNLGDVVEIQGNSGYITIGRITEHVRSQDAAGEKKWDVKDTLQ